MDTNTMKLIEQLAAKLGTTSEYLWQILVNQAFISGIVVICYFVIVLIAGFILLKAHKHFSNRENEFSYHEKDEALIVPMVIGTLMWGICFFIVSFSMENAIYGIVNPEYWALHHILEHLK